MKFGSNAVVGIIFSLLLSSSAFARDAACEGCNYSQMSSKATQLGKGQHRIYSLSTDKVYGFEVRCSNEMIQRGGDAQGTDKSGGADMGASSRSFDSLPSDDGTQAAPGNCPFQGGLVTEEMYLGSLELAAFDAVHDFYVKNGNNATDISVNLANVNIGSAGDSVYSTLSNHQSLVTLYDYLREANDTVQGLFMAAAAMLAGNFNILNNEIFISVTYKDGSKITISFNVNTRIFAIVPYTAKNPNGSAVVGGNQEMYRGEYPVNNMNIEAYMRYLTSMNVTVNRVSGGPRIMSCSWDGTRLICILPF